jgi:hypothetical protein
MILDMNVPIEGTSSGDVSTHIGAEKLNDLAPIMGKMVEQEVAPDAPHDEMAINYINTGDSMNRAMAIVDINFAKKIASIIDPDLGLTILLIVKEGWIGKIGRSQLPHK